MYIKASIMCTVLQTCQRQRNFCGLSESLPFAPNAIKLNIIVKENIEFEKNRKVSVEPTVQKNIARSQKAELDSVVIVVLSLFCYNPIYIYIYIYFLLYLFFWNSS